MEDSSLIRPQAKQYRILENQSRTQTVTNASRLQMVRMQLADLRNSAQE